MTGAGVETENDGRVGTEECREAGSDDREQDENRVEGDDGKVYRDMKVDRG